MRATVTVVFPDSMPMSLDISRQHILAKVWELTTVIEVLVSLWEFSGDSEEALARDSIQWVFRSFQL